MKKSKKLNLPTENTEKANAIRLKYEENGVAGYYSQFATQYINPHFEYIKALLIKNQPKLDYTKGLDFCAGNGEVSQVWQALGYTDFVGSDCFTFESYEKNLGISCFKYSFEDIVKSKFVFPHHFSVIVCSFAMHLCPEKWLFSLVNNLFLYTDVVAIITPHKRPQLEIFEDIVLDFEDFVLTEKGKKVFLKVYKRKNEMKICFSNTNI